MAESTGVVVQFYDNRGFGFIKPDDGGENMFIHFSEIKSDGYKSLCKGQKVKFLVVERFGRKKAVNVTSVHGSRIDRNRNRDGNGGGRRGGDNGYESSRGGFRGGNGNGGWVVQCYSCGGFGHFATDCTSKSGGDYGACYNCGEFGHLSRECNNYGGGGCYNYGERRHLARDCKSGSCNGGSGYSRSGGGGGGLRSSGVICHHCGEPGHFARECPAIEFDIV